MPDVGEHIFEREKGYRLTSDQDWNPVARQLNRLSTAWLGQGGLAAGGGVFTEPPTNRRMYDNVVRVRNDTGDFIQTTGIVAVKDAFFNPESDGLRGDKDDVRWMGQVSYAGELPSWPDDIGRTGVAIENIAPDEYGRVAVAGLVKVKLYHQGRASGMRYAELINSDTEKFRIFSGGSHRIIWSEDISGERWGVVELNCREMSVWVELSDALYSEDTAMSKVLDWDSSTGKYRTYSGPSPDGSPTVKVRDVAKLCDPVAAGIRVRATWEGEGPGFTTHVAGCPCTG